MQFLDFLDHMSEILGAREFDIFWQVVDDFEGGFEQAQVHTTGLTIFQYLTKKNTF